MILFIDRLIIISISMNTKVPILLFVLFALAMCGLRIKNMRLVDDQDRQLLLHGGCVIVKVPPYFPITDHFDYQRSFVDRDVEIYKELGMNGVRLGAMWAGVQPQKDQYNQTYIQQLVQLVNKLGQNGIYTMLDFHQDIISEKFCGDGVPVWLIDEIKGYKTFPFPAGKKIPMNASGKPDWDLCDHAKWGKYYFTYDVGDVFNHLYNPRSYLHKKFVQFWQKIAKTFRGNPYVIAYELINEPFVGNAIRNPLLLLPMVAERVKFQRFYDSVVQAIRKEDPDTNICFEPITFDFAFGSGFSHVPGGNMYRNKSMLCYHFESPPVKSLKTMNARLRDMKRLGIPVLMSEFGGGGHAEVRQFVEDHLQSYFYWQYKNYGKNWGSHSNSTFSTSRQEGGLGIVNPDGSIDDAGVPNVARTILQKTAGHLKSMAYRVETGHFSAVYEAIPGGTSELYLSKNRIYKNGYTIDIFPRKDVRLEDKGNIVQIIYEGKESRQILVTVQKL